MTQPLIFFWVMIFCKNQYQVDITMIFNPFLSYKSPLAYQTHKINIIFIKQTMLVWIVVTFFTFMLTSFKVMNWKPVNKLYFLLLLQIMNTLKRKRSKNRQQIIKQLPTEQATKYKEFFKLINEQKQHNLFNKIKDYYGKNSAVNYKPEYHFTQQWESQSNRGDLDSGNLLETLGGPYIIYSILTMILYVLGIWTITTQRYFGTREISSKGHIYELLIIMNASDILLKVYLTYKQNLSCPELSQFCIIAWKNIILLLYCCAMLISGWDFLAFNFIEIPVIYLLYSRASEIYGYIKVMEFGLHYQNHLKIIDLLLNIFIQAHVFSLILFTASKIDPLNNWVSSIGIQQESYMVKYINAIYFSCTTILTIGYGDISPKSVEEKLITVIIQIVGVIAFGYLLNQMGHTLSKMRQQKETMERDLQTISKLSKYYNLQPKVQNKVRTFILNNQRAGEQLKIEDENRLLMKISDNLRQEIHLQTSINIVKSCIFYLCHWTKNMQQQIAQRLQKRMFAPNQKVVTSNGQQRVYIIKKGRIDVTINRYGNEREQRKVLKVMDTTQKEHLEVTDNIYGYTFIFSNRPCKLEATAKDFTSTFSVSKEDILYCITKNDRDFEYYHQIKSRIDQSTFCEEFEAPSMKNIRQHYCPSYIVTIKKYRASLERDKNQRQFRIRHLKNRFRLVSAYSNANRRRGDYEEETSPYKQQTIIFKSYERFTQKEIIGDDNCLEQDNCEQKSDILSSLPSFRAELLRKSKQEKDNKKVISSDFETSREYTNFFNKSNLLRVLYDLEKDNSMERRFGEPQKQKTQSKK